MTDPIVSLQQRYAELLQRLAPQLAASPFQREVQTRPTHNGDAHVEYVGARWHYVVTERGAELQHRIAANEEELLYWLIDDAVAGIVARQRTPWWTRWRRRDPRRAQFAAQVALLAKVEPAWAERKRQYHAELLQRYPFRDQA